MRLFRIIEGLGFTQDITPQQRNTAMLTWKDKDFELHFGGKDIYLDPKDKPGDIIKLEPANMKQPLSAMAVDPASLRSIESGAVYYGFRTVPANQHDASIMRSLIEPIERVMDKYGARGRILNIANVRQMAREFMNPAQYAYTEPGQPKPQPDQEAAQELSDAIEAATEIHDKLELKVNLNDLTLRNAAAQAIKVTGAKYAKAASYAMAQRLKHPTPADQPIIDQFLDMCMEQLAKLPNVEAYDYVVTPESSSGFNNLLAQRIRKEIGALPGTGKAQPLTIQKRLGKDVTVSKDQLRKRARQIAPKYKNEDGTYDVNYRGEEYEVDTEDAFVKLWTENEYQKLMKDVVGRIPKGKKAAIKGQSYLDKRRYVKLFAPDGAEQTAGKSVLIIDDNIVGGATVELIHEILASVQPPPRVIHVFIPLYISQT